MAHQYHQQEQRLRCRAWACGHSRGRRGWDSCESSTDLYTPPYVSQRASGELLRDAGSSEQCSVMTWMDGMRGGTGARFSREWREIYTHLWLSHVVVQQRPTQHCKVIILRLKQKNRRIIAFQKGKTSVHPQNNQCSKDTFKLSCREQLQDIYLEMSQRALRFGFSLMSHLYSHLPSHQTSTGDKWNICFRAPTNLNNFSGISPSVLTEHISHLSILGWGANVLHSIIASVRLSKDLASWYTMRVAIPVGAAFLTNNQPGHCLQPHGIPFVRASTLRQPQSMQTLFDLLPILNQGSH